ncbi:glycine betaine ABC transporter substrate-binding protein [Marinactinospora thermotolerans]|uniref:Osmoprotectant transport system substrate-binding protein n=1 Tax=Marinactinospora thermotolerans DSM 45154 TaxID=1122192 RepID=A0A1T4T840_9ACTN|nr:glycine betaine ABC transporter substrate-binding protein [Marinactinospora thermotolerans]SKA36596.1 osmoprotectant transport system substrate-binding protein [Marinactinospora thermotolerans DSM 45154]
MSVRLRSAVAAGLSLALVTSGCGLQSASGYIPPIEPGSIPHHPELEGEEVRVTSKELTEQLILGKIAVLALDAAGFEVIDQTNIQGSDNARRSMLIGENDLMWEYTGTAWLVYEGQDEVIPDSREQFERIRDLDRRENGMVWFDPPAPMNNTYAIVVTPETAQKYDLSGISDIANIPQEERSLCMDTEFFNRDDGLTALRRDYDLPEEEFPSSAEVMSAGVVYPAVSDGACTLGSAYSTDGRIDVLGLEMLEDDRKAFPIYNPAITVKEEFAAKYPQLEEIFAPIAEKLDNETITRLNARVDEEGQEPVYVARDWMVQEGFIREGDALLSAD